MPVVRDQRLDLVLASVVALLFFALPPLPSIGDLLKGGEAPDAEWSAVVGDRAVLSHSVADGVLRLYLRPDGADSADGLSPRTAIRSLARAQRLIAHLRPRTDVEVRIAPGVYVAAPVRWTTYVPGRSITFLPVDYQYGDSMADAARPVFRGDGRAGFWFVASLPSGHTGGEPRLRFYHLQVERYSGGGITIDGGTTDRGGVLQPAGAGHNRNTIYGMVFRRLGSKHVESGTGYGAIDLINSRRNVIQNNRFEQVENSGSDDTKALVHGIYLAHGSSDNVVQDNQFDRVSGDPIRTRNSSGANHMSGNVFARAGANAYLSDWFVAAPSPGAPRECPSRGNQFYGNTLRSGYDAGEIKTWSASPAELDRSVRRWCQEKSGKRVRAWGNRDVT